MSVKRKHGEKVCGIFQGVRYQPLSGICEIVLRRADNGEVLSYPADAAETFRSFGEAGLQKGHLIELELDGVGMCEAFFVDEL